MCADQESSRVLGDFKVALNGAGAREGLTVAGSNPVSPTDGPLRTGAVLSGPERTESVAGAGIRWHWSLYALAIGRAAIRALRVTPQVMSPP